MSYIDVILKSKKVAYYMYLLLWLIIIFNVDAKFNNGDWSRNETKERRTCAICDIGSLYDQIEDEMSLHHIWATMQIQKDDTWDFGTTSG